ncbi:MAG: glucose 1-dehydrogenase [Candidatus Baltobacteraceae bacterium]
MKRFEADWLKATPLKFDEKVALVTGASRGIGRAIAVDLAGYGADLVLIGRDRGSLVETAEACRSARPAARTEIVLADVTDRDAVEAAVAKAIETFGRVDFAINNAGQSADGLLLRLKDDVIDQMLGVNLKSAFHLCGAVAKPMMKQRAGSIVLISSIVALTGNAGQSAYAAAKAGLLGLTKSLAKELGSRNIRVNAVAPGFIDTAMTENMPETAKDHYIKSTALGRLGKPEDVSGIVSFLCSEAAGYMTGQTVVVDGGIVM